MSAIVGSSTSKSAVAKLGAALEKFKVHAKSLSEPIKDRVINSATRLVGISEMTSKYGAEHQKVLDNLVFTTTRVLDQLPADDQLPEEMRDVVTSLVTIVHEVEEKLKVDHGKLTSIVMSQISETVTDLNQKLDKHRLDFAVVGVVQTMKLVGGAGMGRPTELPAALLPPKPAHFCGRDDMVATIVELLLKDESCRIPLLGPGGIGKTSIAVAAINNSDVKAKYRRYIWFISCESMTSGEGIVASLAASLGIPQGGSMLDSVFGMLSSYPQVLVVLDNLETIWDSQVRLDVETLLQQLAGVSGLSLLVTMRGALRPAGVDWSAPFRDTVAPLTLQAAHEMWLGITGKVDDTVDELLRLLDGLPLAINLMAQHGQIMSSAELIKVYDDEKAKLLSRGAVPSHLTSLEVSIELSLNSASLREEPNCALLLSVLCLLPDGLSNTDINVALPSMLHATRAAMLLLEAAIVMRKQDRLCVLAPVREYIVLRHPPGAPGLTDLRKYHIQLARLAADFGTENALIAQNTLRIEFGNINAVLVHAWNSRSAQTSVTELEELTAATLHISWLPRSTGYGDCSRLLEIAVEHFRAEQDYISLAKLLHSMGDGLRMLNRWDQAMEKLEEAKGTFDNIGDRLGAAQCTQCIGDVLTMLDRYEEATLKLEEAKEMFDSVGDRLGAARCTRRIGDVLFMLNRSDEAMEKLEEAKETFDSIGDRLGAAQCTQSIGDVLRMLDRYEEAMLKLEEAKGTCDSVGDRLGAARCTRRIGDVLAMLNRYDEAMVKLEEAKGTFDSIGHRLGAAQCTLSIGDMLRMLNRYDEAMEKLEEAKGTFDRMGDGLGVAQCTQSIGGVLFMLNRDDEALEKLEEAKGTFDSIGDRLGAAECTQNIGDVLWQLNWYDEAKEKLEEAKGTFDSIGARLGAAQCMRSIGDVLRMWNRYDEASEKLMESKRVCEEISDVYGLAWTYRRLKHAIELFASIGHSGDVRACEAKLRKLRAAAVDDRTDVSSNMPTPDVPTPTVSTPDIPTSRMPTSRLGRLGTGAKRLLGGLSGGSRRRQG